MQTSETELRAQQLVLAFLGFYGGKIDGIWSDATISAMKKFEMDDRFLPAVPTIGMPFKVNCRLPKGMYWDKKIVSHRGLTVEAAQKLLNERAPAPVVEKEVLAPKKYEEPEPLDVDEDDAQE